MKKIAVLICIAAILGLAGCSNNNNSQNEISQLASQNEALQKQIDELKNGNNKTAENTVESEIPADITDIGTTTEKYTDPIMTGKTYTDPPTTTEAPKKEYSYGDTFVFDNLEITFLPDYDFDFVNNRYSDYNGEDVIKFHVTIKNIKNESYKLSSYSYIFFGPSGNEIADLGYYFDDDYRKDGEMRSGAIQDTYMHTLYAGDGDYYIEFTQGKKIEVKLPVKKQ